MPYTARIVFLDDGLEVFVLEGNAGVSLSSYRRMLPALRWKSTCGPPRPA